MVHKRWQEYPELWRFHYDMFPSTSSKCNKICRKCTISNQTSKLKSPTLLRKHMPRTGHQGCLTILQKQARRLHKTTYSAKPPPTPSTNTHKHTFPFQNSLKILLHKRSFFIWWEITYKNKTRATSKHRVPEALLIFLSFRIGQAFNIRSCILKMETIKF